VASILLESIRLYQEGAYNFKGTTIVSNRISHSILDPFITRPLKNIYANAKIPRWYPPEGIVAIGHICAIAGAVGFIFCTQFWWGGLLAAIGVAMNHLADVWDGTHARSTGQCRNGGELLDHFVDPLSFSYWVTGLAYASECLLLGIGGVIVIYATAVLTNIKAKIIGEFTLSQFGPTEFKSLLVLFGIFIMSVRGGGWYSGLDSPQIAFWFLVALFVVGVVQLPWSLWRAVVEVNQEGSAPDNTEWQLQE